MSEINPQQVLEEAQRCAERAEAAAEKISAASDIERSEKQYYYLEEIVGNINGSCLEIKKWSVTSASIVALIGQLGVGSGGAVMALVAMLALAFWITEAIWRKNQAAFICHIREIESESDKLKISKRWSHHYLGNETKHRSPTIMARFFSWETMLPHLFIVIIAGVLAALFFADIWAIESEQEPDSVVVQGIVETRMVQ